MGVVSSLGWSHHWGGLVMGVVSSLGWSHYGGGLIMGVVSLWGWSHHGGGLVMGVVSPLGWSHYGGGLTTGVVSLWGGLIMGFVPVGFLTREERRRLDALRSPYNKFWVPCVWFGALAGQARREGRVRDDCTLKLLMEELNRFRANCSLLFHYDWISVPLVYTQ
ncbi:bestrophin-2, partial [Meleagris gallopavo]|uniref:bestrophin-2 n=1 Tax=Meleagris gallopavo TaxID=9103 RepID=UPI00093D095E